MFCRVAMNNSAVLNLVNSVNALCILLRTVISFYLHYINTFVLFGQVPAPSKSKKRGSIVTCKMYQ